MRGKRLQQRAQLARRWSASRTISGSSSCLSELALLLGRTRLGLLQPWHEARHRRQRDERVELGQLAAQFLDHLLDQEIAERNAAEPALGVGDRIEHRGARALDRHRLPVHREQRRDRARNRLGQRHLDEDQRGVGQRGMEEGVAAAVGRIDAAAQIVPVADLVHGLVADDLFEDVRRRRPVDPAQHEKPPVEPRAEQMRRRRGRARRDPVWPFMMRQQIGRAWRPGRRCRPARG